MENIRVETPLIGEEEHVDEPLPSVIEKLANHEKNEKHTVQLSEKLLKEGERLAEKRTPLQVQR